MDSDAAALSEWERVTRGPLWRAPRRLYRHFQFPVGTSREKQWVRERKKCRQRAEIEEACESKNREIEERERESREVMEEAGA